MKIVFRIIPIIYALCVVYISYQSSTWVGGLIEEPTITEIIIDITRLVSLISGYILYGLSLMGKLSIKYCYFVLLIHSVLFIN